MSNEVKNTNASANVVENAENANTQTAQFAPKSYTRVIIDANFDNARNCVWLKLNEPFKKGTEDVDSFGKNPKKISECGAHPLFVLCVKAGKKPLTSVCLLLGATIKFNVVFGLAGETIDGFTLEEDTWCVTNVKISPNNPDQFFIDAAKQELQQVDSL